jgi:hypothetical protein
MKKNKVIKKVKKYIDITCTKCTVSNNYLKANNCKGCKVKKLKKIK